MMLTDKKLNMYIRDILLVCRDTRNRIDWNDICKEENAAIIDKAIDKTSKELKRIDRLMSSIKPGDIFYYEDIDVCEVNWFRFEIDGIVNHELGIVIGHEPDASHAMRKRLNIQYLYTEEEFKLNKKIY